MVCCFCVPRQLTVRSCCGRPCHATDGPVMQRLAVHAPPLPPIPVSSSPPIHPHHRKTIAAVGVAPPRLAPLVVPAATPATRAWYTHGVRRRARTRPSDATVAPLAGGVVCRSVGGGGGEEGREGADMRRRPWTSLRRCCAVAAAPLCRGGRGGHPARGPAPSRGVPPAAHLSGKVQGEAGGRRDRGRATHAAARARMLQGGAGRCPPDA